MNITELEKLAKDMGHGDVYVKAEELLAMIELLREMAEVLEVAEQGVFNRDSDRGWTNYEVMQPSKTLAKFKEMTK